MKRFFLVNTLLLVTIYTVSAQTVQTTRVRAGEDVSKAISDYGTYRFPAFTEGVIFLKNGAASRQKLNYNFLVGEMQFISSNGDTLAIANSDEVKFISISDTVFYYNKAYMEQLANYDTLHLAVQRNIKIDYEKIGAYGQANPTSAIDNNQSFFDGPNTYHLTISQDAVINNTTTYYFFYKNEPAVIATKANFLKIFPGDKTRISEFIKGNNIDFKKVKDIEKLLTFYVNKQ